MQRRADYTGFVMNGQSIALTKNLANVITTLVSRRPSANHLDVLLHSYWCEVTLDIEPQPATPRPLNSPTDWSATPDVQLIEACLGGDEAAWAALLARYGRLIYTIPLRFGFSKSVADEIFQETCLILLEGLPGLEDRHRLRSWLMTVTRRACLQRIHRPAAPDADPLHDTLYAPTPTIEEQLQQLEQQHLVQTALSRLPERDQQLLRALFFEEPRRPYEEIARDLGISEGSIGPLRARGLKRLHQEIVRLERP